jgi:hypothetical protein
MENLQKIQIVGAIMLLMCIFPLPYGYYTLTRLITTFIGIYLACNYYSKNKNELALSFIFIAVLFQPFIKISLGRDLWVIVDVVVAIFLLVLAFKKK